VGVFSRWQALGQALDLKTNDPGLTTEVILEQ
jgi:hypothetical protein